MDSEYISEAEAYKSQLDTSVRALKNVRKKRDEYYEETVCLRTQVKELTEVLDALLGGDEKMQVGIGGNPYYVKRFIENARATVAKVKE